MSDVCTASQKLESLVVRLEAVADKKGGRGAGGDGEGVTSVNL